MATNPMQRKARQSFLLGAIITLLISLVIIVFLFMQMNKMKEELNNETKQKYTVSVLKQDVESGQELTMDMFEQREVTQNAVPADATSITTVEGTPIAKIDLKANTVLTATMIEEEENKTTDDMREQTYNMISLPIDLITGDYVDIRLMLPNGQDYIVLSKKKAIVPDVEGVYLADTIKLNLSEGDLLTLSSAIVEAYQMEGSKLYAIKYAEAGNQKAATETYVPTNGVIQQIQNNPNIVSEAMTEIKSKWTTSAQQFRNEYINKADKDTDKAKEGIQQSTQASQEDREEYLATLYAY